ncbi:MAG: hypothetical protein IKP68_03105 [Clostridia bacterium]|nr:hypothetical protein [Clostridia bacterium]
MDAPLFDGLDKILGNEQMMSKIKALADEMSGGAVASDAPAPSSGAAPPPKPPMPPPSKTKVGGYCAILSAIRPYLDVARQKRVDKVISVLRLADTAKIFIGL